MERIVDWIGQHLWTIIIVTSVFIQIAPIKINPLSSLLNWVGKSISQNTSDKIDGLTKDIERLQKDVMTNEKDRIRWEVLAFANSCRQGHKHTQDEFKHIIALNDKYTDLLTKTQDSNGVFDIEYKWISDIYKERLQKNDFL